MGLARFHKLKLSLYPVYAYMNKATIKNGLDAIAEIDQDVATSIQRIGYPEPRIRPPGFETLLSTIVSQQLSIEAARTIMGRVRNLMPDLTPDKMLALPVEALRGAGLSGRKVEYATTLARAITDGQFIPAQLAALDDESAISEIVALRGFGRWSAEIYLMFSLQRRDIFPADDLALQLALQKIKGMDSRPTAKLAREAVIHWAPWRSVGSLFLWHFYRGAPT